MSIIAHPTYKKIFLQSNIKIFITKISPQKEGSKGNLGSPFSTLSFSPIRLVS
jgi:hypothetical protein